MSAGASRRWRGGTRVEGLLMTPVRGRRRSPPDRSGPLRRPDRDETPKSRTRTRSARSITMCMSCSTRTMARSSSRRMSRRLPRHVVGLLEVHAGDRFVEEEQLGLHAEHPAELEPLLHTVRQQPDRPAAVGVEVEERHHPFDDAAVGDLVVLRSPDPGHRAEEPRLHQVMPAEHQVLDDVEVLEQAEVLECAADAELGDLGRALPTTDRPVEPDVDRSGADTRR